MKELTHWKQLINPDYIGAYSLEKGKDLTVTILSVGREIVKGKDGKTEECTVAKLKGQKPFIINRTNAKTITKIYGTPYIEEWVGKQITLYATVTKVAGEEVECLRIRKEKPQKETIGLDSDKYVQAKDSIEMQVATVEQIKTKYNLTKDAEKELTDIQNSLLANRSDNVKSEKQK